jgi:signal recognition particle receptor subunit beta
MTTPVKVLVAGPEAGVQEEVISSISEVKIRSSARNPKNAQVVPMDLGRVKIGDEFDLQILGCLRDDVGVIEESVAPGILGAIVLMNAHDVLKPNDALSAVDALGDRELPTLVAAPEDFEAQLLASQMRIEPTQLFQFPSINRNVVKHMLVRLIEVALDAAIIDE